MLAWVALPKEHLPFGVVQDFEVQMDAPKGLAVDVKGALDELDFLNGA